MRGEPIEAVKVGLQTMTSSLRRDPYALETVWLSVITFDLEAKVLVPLTELEQFSTPNLRAPETSPTNLGEALELLFKRYRLEIKKSTLQEKGDWLPLLLVMTDGKPSDTQLFNRMVAELKNYPFAKIIACAAGAKAKVEPLKALTDEIYALDTMDAASFGKFWAWVSTTVGRASLEVGSIRIKEEEKVPEPSHEPPDDELPPPPEEIRIVF